MAANTLTSILPTAYSALNKVLREPFSLIRQAYRNSSAEQVALNQPISYPVVPAFGTANDNTPAATAPDATGITIGNETMTITQSKNHRFNFNGEEQRSISQDGLYANVLEQIFAQAFRKHINTIEAYCLGVAYKSSSRAVGTAGTAPFASNTDVLAEAYKILTENASPRDDLQCVINPAAAYNLRKLDILKKANESGDNMYRTAILGNLYGFMINESAGVALHTAGTGSTTYAVNLLAGYAAGSKTIALDGGSGTILAGDVFTNSQSGRDSNKYVVKTALTAGSLVLNNPGIVEAWVNDDITAVGASYRANLAFDRYGIHIVTRAPLMPEGGDGADDVQMITDPVSGLSFQIAMYGQYRQRMIEVAIAYDCKVVQPESVVTIMG
jgi:hypothetical protein